MCLGHRTVIQYLQNYVLDTENTIIMRCAPAFPLNSTMELWYNEKMWGEQKEIFVTVGKNVVGS